VPSASRSREQKHPNRFNRISARRRAIEIIAVVALLAIGSTLIVKVVKPSSCVLLFVVWCIGLTGVGFRNRRLGRLGVIVVNVGVLFGALSVAEWFARRTEKALPRPVVQNMESYIDRDHPFLGYAPRPDGVCRKKVMYRGEPIWEVTYRSGPDGLRPGPDFPDDLREGSILVFGCSFAYGEALGTDQTLPYRLEERLQGRYRVYNMAFLGWGPHQALAAIENGWVAAVVRFPPRYVVYSVLPDHVRRVAGQMAWDSDGPRYTLCRDRGVCREGRFSDRSPGWDDRLTTLMKVSAVGRTIAPRGQRQYELCGAVVAAVRDRANDEYPGSEFHVLFWDYDDGDISNERLAEELRGRDLRVHLVSEILEGYHTDPARYTVHEKDRHPNALAADEVARFLAEDVVGER
jgi:hypothetical protein